MAEPKSVDATSLQPRPVFAAAPKKNFLSPYAHVNSSHIRGRRFTPIRHTIQTKPTDLQPADEKYHHEPARGIAKYDEYFTSVFKEYRGTFKRMTDVKVLDSGAGKGIAMAELLSLEKTIVKCTCITKHFFQNVDPEIAEQISEMERSGRMKKLFGFSEDILPRLQERYHLITDLFGAYTYSANRHVLVEQYFRCLELNGRAFIFLNGTNFITNDVILSNGEKQRFEIFLTKTFPKIFTILGDFKVLVINKISDERLDLNLRKKDVKMQRLRQCESFHEEATVEKELDYSQPGKVEFEFVNHK